MIWWARWRHRTWTLDSSSRKADMASSQDQATGPDLRKGVPDDRIPDNGMLLGHFGDDAVLVARGGPAFSLWALRAPITAGRSTKAFW